MHKLDDVHISDEQIKSLLVQNRSIYSGFTNTIRTEFRLSDPERNQNREVRMDFRNRANSQALKKPQEIENGVSFSKDFWKFF